MATKITLHKSYVDGQGVGASAYITYAQHLDADHAAIEGLLDQLVDEITGLKGPNTLIGLDLAQINDPAGPYTAVLSGVIGEHSMWPTINGVDNTLLDVAKGQAIVASNRVAITAGMQLDGSILGGAPATGYVAITSTGVITLESADGAKDMDIASMTWNGSNFTGTATQECEVFVDGDDLNMCLDRPVTSPTFAAKDFRLFSGRIAAIEMALAGLGTDLDGDPIGAHVHPDGAPGTPGVTFVTQQDLGWYRSAANTLAAAAAGVLRLAISNVNIAASLPLYANSGIVLDDDASPAGAIQFGEDQDASAYYDGTDLLITTDLQNPSDLALDCGTEKTLRLVEEVWDDLRVALSAGQTGVSNPPSATQFMNDGSGSVGVFAFAFADQGVAGNEEQMFFNAQLPHRYAEGTDIEAHIHWSPAVSGGAGEFVKWGLEYTWINVDGTFGNTTIITSDASGASTATTSGDGTLTADKHYVTKLGTISGSGKTVSSMLVCRIFRNSSHADDDLTEDAFGFEVDFHFQIDTLGSRQEFIK